MNQRDFTTICVHGNKNKYDTTGAISVPIYQTATFAHPSVGVSTGFDYSRLHNPTRAHLEETVNQLEGGVGAIAFATGMAAVTALMELFSSGDHIIASDDLYGGSHRLFHHISSKNNLVFDFVDTGHIEQVVSLIRPTTKAIFIETPTNPMMQVTDIKTICQQVNHEEILVIVDNTFLTPYYQKPLALGADVVIHSGTKFLGGHNDTLAGFLVTSNESVLEKLAFIAKTIGACLSPMDSWLLIRGIKTLPIRMDRQQVSAMKIANWLQSRSEVIQVYYIGLEDHARYAVSVKQATGFGSMISFEVASETMAKAVLEQLQIIQYAESLGGVESLITYPMMQTHADVPKATREAKGINERLLRLSVGIENVEDLIDDLEQAFSGGKDGL